jgi:hypothetical protein
MKAIRFLSWTILLLTCTVPQSGSAQERASQAATLSAPPTGIYAPLVSTHSHFLFAPTNSLLELMLPTNNVPLFTLHLETNGTYEARMKLNTDARRGTWHWDAQNGEFFLTPGSFTFYIRRLPVDKLNTNRLVSGFGYLVRQESE